jgi:hypothetical protein
MAGSGAARWVLVAVAGAMLVFGSARLVWVRRADRHLDVAEVLMGTGALGMLAPHVALLPERWWAALFAADAGWLLAVRARHGAHLRRRSDVRSRYRSWEHYAHQVAANLAMLYMLLGSPPPGSGGAGDPMGAMVAASGPGAMPGASGGAGALWAKVPVVLAFYFLLDAGWAAARLLARRAGCYTPAAQRSRLGALLMTPALTVGRQVAMAVGMAAMLSPIRWPVF